MRLLRMSCIVSLLAFSLFSAGQEASKPSADPDAHRFHLTSTNFENHTTLPLSTLSNIPGTSGANQCSIDGSPGGDQSPELTWGHARPETKSFVVVAYDTTAAFTHWGMYNIPATATGLPENAGVAGSTYGQQVVNDFFAGAEYDGPCPPQNVQPFTHHYAFTVYALDITLKLPGSANFPPAAETLYQALIRAGRDGHILESSSLTGLYSTTVTP